MSHPSREQVEQIVARFVALMNEWDDAHYMLIIRRDENAWCFHSNASPVQKMGAARGLLREAIDSCSEDAGIDT